MAKEQNGKLLMIFVLSIVRDCFVCTKQIDLHGKTSKN